MNTTASQQSRLCKTRVPTTRFPIRIALNVLRILGYHVSHIEDRQGQIDQARAILEFLAASCREDAARGPMVRKELESVRRLNDAFFFHEYLEASNTPIYFHEFADRAHTNGLQYLGEADVSLIVVVRSANQTL